MDAEDPPAGGPVLEFADVSFAYPAAPWSGGRRRRVLRDVSFTLPAGSVCGLVGVNGAGKTTLLELAAGTLVPSSGVVRRPGRPGRAPDAGEGVGYCPDVPGLPPFLTAAEALRLFAGLRGLSRDRSRAACEALARRLDLDAVLYRRIAELSRGNLVRVGVAQALLDGPELVLLDESFASLDPVAQDDLCGVIRDEARRGAAVLVSSHQVGRLGTVADRALLLRDGGVSGPFPVSTLRSGTLERLLAGGD